MQQGGMTMPTGMGSATAPIGQHHNKVTPEYVLKMAIGTTR